MLFICVNVVYIVHSIKRRGDEMDGGGAIKHKRNILFEANLGNAKISSFVSRRNKNRNEQFCRYLYYRLLVGSVSIGEFAFILTFICITGFHPKPTEKEKNKNLNGQWSRLNTIEQRKKASKNGRIIQIPHIIDNVTTNTQITSNRFIDNIFYFTLPFPRSRALPAFAWPIVF